MQNYTDIPATKTLTNSRQDILNNDLTAISCSSGSSFPTTYPIEGMLCFRTDTKLLYQLEVLPATTDSNWKVIADLNETFVPKSYIDTNFALKNGDYAGLRAQATTKTDVGLSNIPNSISASLSINSDTTLATSAAAYNLSNLITAAEVRITATETALPTKALLNGSSTNNFSASSLYAASTIYCNGDIVAYAGVTIPSDRRLKKHVLPIDNALERLESLTGVTYVLKSNQRKYVGLIAQEVAKTIPEAIRDYNGFLALDYGSLAGVFVNAINEMNTRIIQLEAKNAKL